MGERHIQLPHSALVYEEDIDTRAEAATGFGLSYGKSLRVGRPCGLAIESGQRRGVRLSRYSDGVIDMETVRVSGILDGPDRQKKL